MTKPAHLAWIDVLRGLSMILVVATHHPALWEHSEPLGRAIRSFSMPLFFFITGLTLGHGMTGRAVLSRMLAYLIPFALLSLVSVPLVLHRHPELSLQDVLLGIVYGTGLTMITVPLWFLPCLAATVLLVFVIDRLEQAFGVTRPSSRDLVQVLVFFALQVAWRLALRHDYALEAHIGWGSWATSGAPWSVEVALVGASWVVLGRLVSPRIADSRLTTQPQWWLLTLLVPPFIGMNALFHPVVDFNLRTDTAPFWGPAVALCGIACAVLLSASLAQRTAVALLTWVGTSTILILWMHASLEKSFYNLLSSRIGGPAAFVVSLALAIALPALATSALKRMPLLYTFIAPSPLIKRLLAVKR